MKDEKIKTFSNKEWKNNFLERLLKFSVEIIELANKLPTSPAGFAIASQLIRAATSIGANFIEAQDASSAKDFTHKLSISLREPRETEYWLKVIKLAELLSSSEIDLIYLNAWKYVPYCHQA